MPPQRFDAIENSADLFAKLAENPGYIIVKFTASWCGPCKKAAPYIEQGLSLLPDNVHYYEIDIDDHFELYGYLKTKKMVNGIPALLCWKTGNIEYIPTNAVLGADETSIKLFFETILKT